MRKQCSHCGEDKPLTDFYKRRACNGGYRPQCKTCYNEVRKVNDAKPEVRERVNRQGRESYLRHRDARIAEMRDWRERNPDYMRQWFAANPEKVSQWNREQYEKNCEDRKAYQRNWQKQNIGKCRANNAKREKAIKQQTPPWADLKAIQKFYVYSAQITEETGVQHNVDHIIPLQGKLVSGLHVEDNLRVIPAKVNFQKSNSYTL
jgi:hypothetical protein